MDPAPALGSALRAPAAMPARERASATRARHQRAGVGPREKVRKAVTRAAMLVLVLGAAQPAIAGEHYALVITGASGGNAYAQKYDKWRMSFVTMLREKFGYPADHVTVLADTGAAGSGA